MQKRREFFKIAMGATIIGVLPTTILGQKRMSGSPVTLKPKRLKKGDTIGLIAPGYAINQEILEETKKTLTNLGFVPYHTERILWRHGYFSHTDEERAKDLNEMFANPQINGILCVRGGYGCTRIMNRIDYESIKKNPKILIGFSDITALLNGIYQETGLITFHGPVGSTLNDPYSISQLQQLVVYPKENVLIKNATLKDDHLSVKPEYERYIITQGSAEGILVGGSLTLINALIGTSHQIDFTNKLVCIEDVEEAPYRIDRMLTQLIEGNAFNKAAGIIFGVCAGCNTSANPNSFSLKEVIMDRIKPLGIPAVYGMSFGHIKNNFTFPIGMKATLDTDKMTLRLIGKAVL